MTFDKIKNFGDSSSPPIVDDISEISGISKNTISAILKNCIEVDNVVLSGKTLMRSYVTVVDREQFISTLIQGSIIVILLKLEPTNF